MGSGSDDGLDLLVIGGGSAGFAAAIRGAELGASVAIVEGGTLGGTCVNVGCVPSKFLIRAAEVRHRAASRAFDGIRASVEPPDLAALIAQKADLVTTLRQQKYADVLEAYPSIRLIRGRATFRSDGAVEVDGEVVSARRIVVATGASAAAPPIPGLADVPHLTSTEALALRELPRRLIVIGGGAIALELAQLFARLGTAIVSCEVRSRLLSGEDPEISTALAGYLAEEGIEARLGATVLSVAGGPGDYRITVEVDGEQVVEHGDQLLVATGRRANTAGFGLEGSGIQLDPAGAIVVDEHLQTTRDGVYAAGDVVAGPAYVYVAAHEGNLAADNALTGNTRTRDLGVVPRVTFTDPAVAAVGITEDEAREAGIEVVVSRLPMTHVPRAIAARDTRGFIKLVADRLSDQLVGAHIVAPEAGDIIQLAVMAMEFGIRVDQIASTLHPARRRTLPGRRLTDVPRRRSASAGDDRGGVAARGELTVEGDENQTNRQTRRRSFSQSQKLLCRPPRPLTFNRSANRILQALQAVPRP